MEHRGHAAGLEHDPSTGRRFGQRANTGLFGHVNSSAESSIKPD
jgi:hypothetical protein